MLPTMRLGGRSGDSAHADERKIQRRLIGAEKVHVGAEEITESHQNNNECYMIYSLLYKNQ